MASIKRPNIDKIDDMMELLAIMNDLGISGKGLKTIEDMKAKVKEHLRRNSSDTTVKAFSVLSKAKNEDMRKRDSLHQMFSQTTECIDRLDDPALSVLNENFGNVKERITTNQDRLVRREYYVLVAGETSSGKSSFLNLLLGEELLPTAVLSSTSTICELKYGLEKTLVLHYKDMDPETGHKTRSIPLNSDEPYLKQISGYVHMKVDREKGSPFTKVEIFWPHELLQNGITVIDSPGVGESQIMDEVVEGYLAKAFAFIYIINSANAGGVQKDRIGKLLRGVKKISDERNERFPSKCALFVCNKWDTVQEKERKEVKDHVIKQLEGCWPDLDTRSQIVYLSTRQAQDAKAHGVVSKEFQVFVTRINGMILTAIETRLQSHWEWLRYLLSRVIYQGKAFLHNADKDQEKTNEQMEEVTTQLKMIEESKDIAIKELESLVKEDLKKTAQALVEHLESQDTQRRFTTWSEEDVVEREATSWRAASYEIVKVFESRLRLFIEEWEEENHVIANTISSLKQRIVKKWNLVESQLQRLENNMIADDGHTTREYPADTDDDVIFSKAQKAIIGITSPLWIPLTIAVGILAVPVVGIWSIKEKILDANTFRKYKKDPTVFLSSLSFSYLDEMASEEKMLRFVKPQFDEAMQYMHHMQARVPEIIDENKKLISQLEKETRSTKQLKEFYSPIYDGACALKGKLDLFVVNDIRRMDVDDSDLKLEQRIGAGGFGSVYQGTLKKSEDVSIDVAIKVSHEVLDATTVTSFLEEEETLSKLDHLHIVKFYGASLRKDHNGIKMVLVMELCEKSLRCYIRAHEDEVPGKSPNQADLKKSIRWALEITDALQYMHKMGIVHRDLKLDNILVTKLKSVKIADVGIAKREKDIIGTIVGTSLYMAPEIWASKRYNSAVDMYSFGITMWEMWYGKLAFFQYHDIATGDLERMVKDGERPTHVTTYQEPLERWQQIMNSCWAKKPSMRPTAVSCHKKLEMLFKDCFAAVATR